MIISKHLSTLVRLDTSHLFLPYLHVVSPHITSRSGQNSRTAVLEFRIVVVAHIFFQKNAGFDTCTDEDLQQPTRGAK